MRLLAVLFLLAGCSRGAPAPAPSEPVDDVQVRPAPTKLPSTTQLDGMPSHRRIRVVYTGVLWPPRRIGLEQRTKADAEKRAKEAVRRARTKGADFEAAQRELDDGENTTTTADDTLNELNLTKTVAAIMAEPGSENAVYDTPFGYLVVQKVKP